jgi:histone H3/H4
MSLKKGFKEDDIKILLEVCSKKPTSKAAALTADVLNMLVEECLKRANEEARKENSDTVELEHLRRILPKLMIDFF